MILAFLKDDKYPEPVIDKKPAEKIKEYEYENIIFILVETPQMMVTASFLFERHLTAWMLF